jgi:hypothetical protein
VIQTQHATELYLIDQIQKQKYREEMQEIHRMGQIELQKLNIIKAQLKLKEQRSQVNTIKLAQA